MTGALWLVDGGITPAKGAVGMLAGREARTPPPDRMHLRHTHDGNRNKDLVKLQ